MKKNFLLLILVALFAFLYSGCSSSKQGMHHRGVNNSHYKGY